MIRWIRTSIEKHGLFNYVASAIGLAAALPYLYSLEESVKIWAYTVTAFATIFFMLLNYCFYSQSVYKDEVKRCAAAKSQLEKAVLKARKSSKG
jgi:hypothetical protein